MIKKIIIFLSLVMLLSISIVYFLKKISNLRSNIRILNKINSSKVVDAKQQVKKIFLTPTIIYQNPQTFEILTWKKYTNNDMRISFDYPDNLKHSYPEGENPSALKEESNLIRVLHGMSAIFSVRKIVTNDDVETWWKKNNAESNNGNGLMPAKITKTFFQNKLAYYFATTGEQQVPSDFYIIPFPGFFLMITFQKHTPLRFVIDSACNEYGECDVNSLYFDRDYDESFTRFNYLIVSRILSSIRFLF